MMNKRLYVEGMTCHTCENRITSALKKRQGIQSVHATASLSLVDVVYDDAQISIKDVIATIEAQGYPVVHKKHSSFYGVLMLLTLLGLSFILLRYGNSLSFDFLPNIKQNMGYGALFVVGLMTSVHCIAMCGGINISLCSREKANRPSGPSFLYNLGRVVSYTSIGGIIGGIGSVLNLTGQLRGYITLLVSVLMLGMALKMLKLFHIPMPKLILPKRLQTGLLQLSKKGPFLAGIANGLMPCGPLQSMQLYALGTGSIIEGALSMFYFSLGTFPLMFALGFISSLLNTKRSKSIIKYSGLLVFTLGITMFSRGAALAGIPLPFQHNGSAVEATLIDNQLQEVVIELSSDRYVPIIVRKDIPVKLIIHAEAEAINGCNNPIVIPSLNIEKSLIPGSNVILFTPTEEGKLSYSCWMGMITSYIEVIDE